MGFGQRIKDLMKEKGLTQDEVVEKAGIPKSTLSKITAGINTNPTFETLSNLASYFDVSLQYLLGYTDTKGHFNMTAYEQEALAASLVSEQEQLRQKMFRFLDEYGKETVDGVIKLEYKRCSETGTGNEEFRPTDEEFDTIQF